jgi:hypothetical protein
MKTLRFARLMIPGICLGMLLVLSSTSKGVTIGQIDDFESGTTSNWANGVSAADPINISTGGPLGAGDNYLQVTSDGVTAGGRLTTYNRNQWIGNYTAAGITGIAMDVQNFGATSLTLRIAFKSTTASGAPSYVSNTGFSIAGNNGSWQHVTFDFSDLTGLASPAALATFMTNPAEMRIIQSALPNTSNGDNVVAQIGVDNIQAVPEPATATLFGLGLAAAAMRRRRR